MLTRANGISSHKWVSVLHERDYFSLLYQDCKDIFTWTSVIQMFQPRVHLIGTTVILNNSYYIIMIIISSSIFGAAFPLSSYIYCKILIVLFGKITKQKEF